MSDATTYSPVVAKALRKADQRIRAATRGHFEERYAACRLAIARLCDLHQFYIAFYRDDETLVFAYSVLNDRHIGPELQNFGPRGLSAWMRTSRRVYRWREDDGALVARGISQPEEEQMRDALMQPLLNGAGTEVLGFIGCLSRTENAFGHDVEQATAWLARALVLAAERDAQEAEDLSILELYPELEQAAPHTEDDLLQLVSIRLTHLSGRIATVHKALLEGDIEMAQLAAEEAGQACERTQVETAQLLLRHKADPLADLTCREREIALLISTEGLSNACIAGRLVISEKTVKGHVGNILRKLGISQRSAIAGLLPR